MGIDLNKLPKKWLPLMLLAIAISVLGLFLYSYVKDDSNTSGASMNISNPNLKSTGIGAQSEEYRNQIAEDNKEKAEKASKEGKSFFPLPSGGEEIKSLIIEEKKPEVKKEEPKTPSLILPQKTEVEKTKTAAVTQKPKQSVTQEQLDFFVSAMEKANLPTVGTVGMVETPYTVQVFAQKDDPSAVPGNNNADKKALDFSVGDILYAVNDVYVNSDAVGTPVMATVLSGKYQGAKIMGSFTSSNETLIIRFNRLSFNGEVYPFEGYAVNAEEAKAGVASKVDTHFFSRWAGLIAGSFLEGFGEAVSQTGSVYTTSSAVSMTEQVFRDYSLEDQAWIAAGKVGEKVADVAEKNFDRKPTITLNVGQPMGVLILNNK